jgi:hypothetical protein
VQIVNSTGKYQNRYQEGRGNTRHIPYPDVLFSKIPEIAERTGYFVEFADNLVDALTFKILKNDLVTVLHRSVVRSAADANHRNKRVSFKSDVQVSLKLLDTKPSLNMFGKIVIININEERLIIMYQTEAGLWQITQASILAVELSLRCTT